MTLSGVFTAQLLPHRDWLFPSEFACGRSAFRSDLTIWQDLDGNLFFVLEELLELLNRRLGHATPCVY